jgi:hypothetical protein
VVSPPSAITVAHTEFALLTKFVAEEPPAASRSHATRVTIRVTIRVTTRVTSEVSRALMARKDWFA